jgi:hypothetical protein
MQRPEFLADALTAEEHQTRNSIINRYPKGQQAESLRPLLNDLRVFIENESPEVKARRASACGILWLTDCGGPMIATHTAVLSLVLKRSKSCLNEQLAKLNYRQVSAQDQNVSDLMKTLGRNRLSSNDARRWSYRRAVDWGSDMVRSPSALAENAEAIAISETRAPALGATGEEGSDDNIWYMDYEQAV